MDSIAARELLKLDPIISQELSKLDAKVPFRAKTHHIYHTWAKTWYSRPELYLQPESIDEIQKVVTLARRCRRRLVVVGSGHSPSDLTCTSSWLVNLDNFNRILAIDSDSGVATFQAGLRLRDLCDELEDRGLTVPNLGSINEQSVAGAISTGTHGSSINYGLLSESISAIKLVLSNAQVVQCSATTNPALFSAALLSLGALGIVVEITFHAVRDFKIEWTQTLHPLSHVLSTWDTTLWTSAEFTRVWWIPYMDKAVIWRADKTSKPISPPPTSYYGGKLGFHTYQFLLYLARFAPSINPWVEWFIFGMQYGFRNGSTTSAVQHGREGLLMDCLFSQYVNEWAIPLSKGPEAIVRFRSFLHDHNNHSPTSKIPYSSRKLYIHSPIEVRVASTVPNPNPHPNFSITNPTPITPLLAPTARSEPTLYLNATMYRPYLLDPPCLDRYYTAFEHLMRDLDGRPHWAKNFTSKSAALVREMYGENLTEFETIRQEVDPSGMFLGEWHKRTLGIGEVGMSEEVVTTRRYARWEDGVEWTGRPQQSHVRRSGTYREHHDPTWRTGVGADEATTPVGSATPSPPMTATSDESFDYMAKGEASVMLPK